MPGTLDAHHLPAREPGEVLSGRDGDDPVIVAVDDEDRALTREPMARIVSAVIPGAMTVAISVSGSVSSA